MKYLIIKIINNKKNIMKNSKEDEILKTNEKLSENESNWADSLEDEDIIAFIKNMEAFYEAQLLRIMRIRQKLSKNESKDKNNLKYILVIILSVTFTVLTVLLIGEILALSTTLRTILCFVFAFIYVFLVKYLLDRYERKH